MSPIQADTHNRTTTAPSTKEQPYYAVPAVLAIIMVSSGVFVLLLAQAIKIFSSMGY